MLVHNMNRHHRAAHSQEPVTKTDDKMNSSLGAISQPHVAPALKNRQSIFCESLHRKCGGRGFNVWTVWDAWLFVRRREGTVHLRKCKTPECCSFWQPPYHTTPTSHKAFSIPPIDNPLEGENYFAISMTQPILWKLRSKANATWSGTKCQFGFKAKGL